MPKSKREKSAIEVEKEILEYLKEKKEPVKFYNLYKDLNLTSGGAQTAIRRMHKKGKVYKKKRVRRFENFIWYKDFDIESPIIDLKDQNEIIFPVRLSRIIGLILQEIPELTLEYDNLTDLFKEAIIDFFHNKISKELRREAVLQAIEKGKISKSLVKQIL
jgi:predicted transcriptional regulator